MVCAGFDAEWLVREALANEVFIFEFMEKTRRNSHVWDRGLIWGLLHHLVDIGKANRLLELGFRRNGLPFVNSRLFGSFVEVHLHRVSLIRSSTWTCSGISCSRSTAKSSFTRTWTSISEGAPTLRNNGKHPNHIERSTKMVGETGKVVPVLFEGRVQKTTHAYIFGYEQKPQIRENVSRRKQPQNR